MVKKVNSNDFKNEIKDGIVFVDFFATWCGPCKMLSPIVDEISEEIKDVKFLKVDVDEEGDIASSYQIIHQHQDCRTFQLLSCQYCFHWIIVNDFYRFLCLNQQNAIVE